MKKQLLTLVILLTSISTFAQFQDTACRKLSVDHALYDLQHDFYQQLSNLNQIGLFIQTAKMSLPTYSQEMMDVFMDQPYYRLLEIIGLKNEFTCRSILTVPIECVGAGYGPLITKLSQLSSEMSHIEAYQEKVIDHMTKLVEFKAEGQVFEREVEMEGDYIDESFIHFFQEIVLNYTNTDKGQLCWFVSMDEDMLIFMWLTPEQMLYMNETLHLHRIVFD